jgi:putative ABC transport system ATP-binding protein
MANDLHAADLILVYRMGAGFHTVLNVEELTVAAGSAVGITGPSGSGKTSLLHVLAGIERPQYGSVRWGDTQVTQLAEADRDRWRRRHLGLVFRDFHLLPGMTAMQNVLLPATFERVRTTFALKDRARQLLTHVGLPGGLQRVETLSRGEMQRAAVARALLFKPTIVLADEPTASLDATDGARVTDLLLELCRDSRSTLLVVSHDPAVLRRLETVHTLMGGRLTRSGEEVLQPC